MDLSELSKKFRVAISGIPDLQVAKKCGVSNTAVASLKEGLKRPREWTVIRLARGLNQDENEWLQLAGYPPIGIQETSTSINQVNTSSKPSTPIKPQKPKLDPRIGIIAQSLENLLTEKPRRVWFSAKTLRKLEPNEKYMLLRAIEEDKGWHLLPQDVDWSEFEEVRKRELQGH